MFPIKVFGLVLFGISLLKIVSPFPTIDSQNVKARADLFEGDIVLHNKNGVIGDFMRWPGNIIVYSISPDFSPEEVNRINLAMEEIKAKTCIRFRERTTEIAYAFFKRGAVGSGCFAFIGRVGIYQEINLEPGCIHHGTITHEIIHTIGFFHEQSRNDRDEFVQIVWNKIQPGMEHNFLKYVTNAYGTTYDYTSLMHYRETAFSIDGSPTIIPKVEGTEIGQRNEMSPDDAIKINRMYNC